LNTVKSLYLLTSIAAKFSMMIYIDPINLLTPLAVKISFHFKIQDG